MCRTNNTYSKNPNRDLHYDIEPPLVIEEEKIEETSKIPFYKKALSIIKSKSKKLEKKDLGEVKIKKEEAEKEIAEEVTKIEEKVSEHKLSQKEADKKIEKKIKEEVEEVSEKGKESKEEALKVPFYKGALSFLKRKKKEAGEAGEGEAGEAVMTYKKFFAKYRREEYSMKKIKKLWEKYKIKMEVK